MKEGLFYCLGLLILSTSGGLGAIPRTDDPRPNIIFIFADDLGYNNLGSYGQALIQTPELDQLATEGMRFTNMYAGAPLCLPSRVSLLTGLHRGHTRVRSNGGGGTHDPIFEEDIVISTVLQAAGYRTAMIGKWALGDAFLGNTVTADNYDGSGALYKHGWDYYLGEPNQTYNHDYYPDQLYRYDPEGLMGAATPDNELVPVPLAGEYTTDLYFDKALEFIDAAKDRPFFLYLPIQTPHFNFVVPEIEPYAAATSWSSGEKVFASMITRMDRDIGTLLNRLETHGIANQTLVIFTSDNGGLSDFDSRFDNNGALSGYKGDYSEGGLKVPFIARWPGIIESGSTSAHLAALYDMMPTFAALAGVTSPSPVDGISILPTLTGEGVQAQHDYLFFGESSFVVKAPTETRTNQEIYNEASTTEAILPVFEPKFTRSRPTELFSSSDPLPLPSLACSNAGGDIVLPLSIPDGISVTLKATTDLTAEWPNDYRSFLTEVGMESPGTWLFSPLPPAPDKLFARAEVFAYSEPALVPENSEGDPDPDPDPAPYHLDHKSSGLRLYADNNGDNAGVVASGTDTTKIWNVVSVNASYFHLVHEASGRKLNAVDYNTVNTAEPGITSDNVQWFIEDAGGGYSRLVNKALGDRLHAKEDGTEFRLTTGTGDNAQWRLVPPSFLRAESAP